MHPDTLFSVSDSISTSELWELLSVEERNKFLGTIKDPQSGPAKELLRSIELDIGNVLPWWDADESIPSISSKRYGKIPEMVRIPTPLLSRPVGPDSGPPLLYNICVVLYALTPLSVLFLSLVILIHRTAYAYITRHLGVSPLSAGPSRASGNDDDDDDSVASTARHLFRALAPFISDKRSRVLFTSMDAVVADMWPRLIESGKANRTSFVLFLRDASNLLVPRRIAEVEESPVKSGSELGSDQEEGEGEGEGEGVKREKLQSEFHKSDVDQRDGLLDNAARSTLLVLSDLINLFRSRRGSENQERETPASAKLIFYAGHIASMPAPILAGFSAEVSTRARALEAEGEIQVGLPHSENVVPVVPERSPSTKKGKERTLIEEL